MWVVIEQAGEAEPILILHGYSYPG